MGEDLAVLSVRPVDLKFAVPTFTKGAKVGQPPGLQEPSATTAFKQKMATQEAKQIYARRSQIAEFPHAWIKQRCGLRQFRCRGRVKVAMEATWACLSYNLTRWFGLKRTLQVQPA
jgi:hypothetical protein